MSDKNFLKSEKVILRPFERDQLKTLAPLVAGWVNDGEATYYMFTGQKPQNVEQVAATLQKDLEKGDLVFLALDARAQVPIGYAGLYDINQTVRKAEFRILIGEKDFWGKGYGTEITELLTFYGFDRLNLNRIYLGFTADNKAAQGAYEKAGYVYEGTLRQEFYRNSRYYDAVRLAILRDDYYQRLYPEHLRRFGCQPQNKKQNNGQKI